MCHSDQKHDSGSVPKTETIGLNDVIHGKQRGNFMNLLLFELLASNSISTYGCLRKQLGSTLFGNALERRGPTTLVVLRRYLGFDQTALSRQNF